MGLNAKEMDEVGDLVNAAFLTAFSNSATVLHPKLLNFAFGLLRREIPYVLFSGKHEGTDRLTGLMYDDADIRDFVLQITMHVFSKFGDTKNRYAALVENIAEAIGFIEPPVATDRKSQENAPIVIMPDELQGLLPTVADVIDVLMWNRWATTMALMMLYLMTPEDLNELLEEKKQREAAILRAQQAAAARTSQFAKPVQKAGEKS